MTSETKELLRRTLLKYKKMKPIEKIKNIEHVIARLNDSHSEHYASYYLDAARIFLRATRGFYELF